MAAAFTAEEILEITSGRLAGGMLPEESGTICTDSRTLSDGQWYVALSGSRFDGHDFLGDAFSAGAIGAIVLERGQYAIANPQFPLIVVPDTVQAHRELAWHWYEKTNPEVVAVIGAPPESFLPAICMSVFSAQRRCHQASVEVNSELDLANVLLSLPQDSEILIVSLPDCQAGDSILPARAVFVQELPVIAPGNFDLSPPRGIALIACVDQEIVEQTKEYFGESMLGCSLDDIEIIHKDGESLKLRLKDSEQIFRLGGEIPLGQALLAITGARELGFRDQAIAAGLELT
jgi:hypothetical protein